MKKCTRRALIALCLCLVLLVPACRFVRPGELTGGSSGTGGAAMTLAIVPQFMPTAISGQGFIAIAAVIFGKWTPHGAYLACLLFGFAQALTVALGGGNFAVPSEILAMLPYVLTIIILILFVGRASAPKANGVPYNKGSRV